MDSMPTETSGLKGGHARPGFIDGFRMLVAVCINAALDPILIYGWNVRG